MENTGAKESTKKRLREIESELEGLRASQTRLKGKWEEEKKYLSEIRRRKEEIERAKVEADEFERRGDLAKVAEIRYGRIIELQNKIKRAQEKLDNMQKSGQMLKEEVDAEDIAEIVSKWTGIPAGKMLETERSKLVKMEDRLHQRLIGQDEAVTATSNAIRRSRAGLQDDNRPIGSFIFLGSTGVGKTELSRALAEFLFDDENAIVRIDMSEYSEKFTVSRLIGAPPGYVGYEEGGRLTEQIRRKPYSVVLLDEIEKAHPEIFNVLLQVLDDGRLTDGKGRTVNFKNTIVIMTSNLGSEILQDRFGEITEQTRESIMKDVRKEIVALLRKRMRPEFLNRVDEIIVFNPLTRREISKIAELRLKDLKKKVEKNGMNLVFTRAAIERLAEIGFDVNYGARPLKRAIQKSVADPLALKLLESRFTAGDTIKVDTTSSGDFVFFKA